ncbi:inactive ubiquitin carboxyl-terminal hydrolase MINDY-4B [Colius striatus]|uniref:inactive ubiquitin carboxyl-terminal hydrolase MINDY-4B n=1 Tax=Colius striatus TaxID=57412 RepID=UPI002B1DC6B0|nr:inactive ubiquitin carboxyl-terminal hydrolase MINDY-4B [Colius striatus]
MGEREAEPTMPQTELEEITSKLSDLNKWREIFSFHGLEISNTTPQPGQGSAGHALPADKEPVGPPPPRSAVPRPLLMPSGTAGQHVSLEMAMGLRKLLFGNGFHHFSCEWANACFRFREPHSDLAYALEAGKGGTRAILMAVQAHIIKYLLFIRNTEYTHLERLCQVSRQEQGQALATALADMLWATAGSRVVVCLTSTASHTTAHGHYKADSLTERIQLFEFSEKAAAQQFIFDHIDCFKGEGSHGVILFLYSLLFSRTLERVQEDLGCTATPLLKCSFGSVTCTQALLSLLLTGCASPHKLDGGPEPRPGSQGGEARQRRGMVGYLRWDRAQPEQQVCAALRTPRLPVWLCSLSGRHSVLFGTDSLLLSHWRAERVFHLYFYNGQRERTETAWLTVDTHSHLWEEDHREDSSSTGKRHPSLEMAIRTKWAGATVSWNGTEPFF